MLFDWHATLVDTMDAMYYALDEVLPRLAPLGPDRASGAARKIEDAGGRQAGPLCARTRTACIRK
jgi:phosphoglycolate phosphatase